MKSHFWKSARRWLPGVVISLIAIAVDPPFCGSAAIRGCHPIGQLLAAAGFSGHFGHLVDGARDCLAHPAARPRFLSGRFLDPLRRLSTE